jgi:hypothetical protein
MIQLGERVIPVFMVCLREKREQEKKDRRRSKRDFAPGALPKSCQFSKPQYP